MDPRVLQARLLRAGAECALEQQEAELQQERASALGRTGQDLQRCLDAAWDAHRAWCAAPSPATGEAARQARAAAAQSRWKLEVQREAVGLYGHRAVHECYPLPPEIPKDQLTGRAARPGPA